MAAVTVATGWPRTVVNGHMREYLYRVDIAADEDYLDIPLRCIKGINCTDDTLTNVGVASITLTSGKSRVVFNSGGAINDCFVRAIGW